MSETQGTINYATLYMQSNGFGVGTVGKVSESPLGGDKYSFRKIYTDRSMQIPKHWVTTEEKKATPARITYKTTEEKTLDMLTKISDQLAELLEQGKPQVVKGDIEIVMNISEPTPVPPKRHVFKGHEYEEVRLGSVAVGEYIAREGWGRWYKLSRFERLDGTTYKFLGTVNGTPDSLLVAGNIREDTVWVRRDRVAF